MSATWTDLRQRVTEVWNSDQDESLIERYRSWRPEAVAQGVSPPELPEPVAAPESELPAPEDLDTLEWFDSEDFLEK